MLPVIVLDAARRDQLDQAEYFDSAGGTSLGDRFVEGCQSAFERLAAFPESGARVRYRHPALEGCRFILVPGFDKVLVFYRVSEDRIEIVRVLHGARDIESVLDDTVQQ